MLSVIVSSRAAYTHAGPSWRAYVASCAATSRAIEGLARGIACSPVAHQQQRGRRGRGRGGGARGGGGGGRGGFSGRGPSDVGPSTGGKAAAPSTPAVVVGDGPTLAKMPEVRVITEKGENLGVLPTAEAVLAASARGLSLHLVSSASTPPVCRMVDEAKEARVAAEEAKEAELAEGTDAAPRLPLSAS